MIVVSLLPFLTVRHPIDSNRDKVISVLDAQK